jgi:hypothetical protein
LKTRRRLLLLAVALAAAALALQCATGGVAKRDDWASAASGRRPQPDRVVVLVPGATGSMLRDAHGAVRWGRGLDLIRPHDGGYALARPLVERDAATELEAFALIDTVRLAGFIRKPVYGPMLRGLEAIGYQRGDFSSPRPADTLFPFAWDWRASHVEGAAKLARSLEAVRRARGVDVLSVALVCQSSGAHLCRYFVKYGDASLAEAEAGRAQPAAGIAVTTVVLVGSSNGGSLRILRELERGRRYIPVAGRMLQPETLFTFPALFEDLPAYRDDLFVDAKGDPLDVDLYDAQSWVRFGWSAFGEEVPRRLSRSGAADTFGAEVDRLDYLRATLDRARRLQRALRADVGRSRAPSYHLIQGRSVAKTPDRAVMIDGELFFAGDREIDRDPRLLDIAAADGDGHAVVESQRWLAPEELINASPTVFVPGGHFEMILTAEAARALADALAD